MKNAKRVLSILLSLMLALGAVAVGGLSASALDGNAQLRIGSDTAISNGDIVRYEGTGWSITENEDGNGVTLNLNNPDLTYGGSCIFAVNLDLTITGSAKLTSNGQSVIYLHEGNLTLNGDFTVLGSTQSSISVSKNLTVEGGSLSVINTANDAISPVGSITVNGGSVYAKTESSSHKAISAREIILNNGEAFALGAEMAKEVLIKVPGTLAGKGTEISPYMIFDYTDLKLFASKVNGGETAACAILTADILCKNSPDDTNYATDWTPIGNYSKQYTGTFDGDGHKITGLTFNNPQQDYAGLFGCVGTKTEGGVTTKGTVKNVGLEGGSVSGNDFVGGVTGDNADGIIEYCYNTGNVSGNEFVGGVVGDNYKNSSVENCYNTGAVSGSDFVGGVAGWNYDNSKVSNCYNTGSVTATAANAYAGGVAGQNAHNNSSVENCYNTGSVTAQGSRVRAGGVVGYNFDSSSVKNCYNTGSVTATAANAYAGGVAGYNSFNNSSVENCYYDSDRVTGIPAIGYEAEATNTNVNGLTTAQMTGANALSNMVFEYRNGEVSPWQTKADGAEDGGEYYWFYPHLKGFNFKADGTPETDTSQILSSDWPAKAEVTAALSEYSSEYDGLPHIPTVTSVKVGDKTLELDRDYTVSYCNESGVNDLPVNAGNYKAVITFLKEKVTGEGVEYVRDESHAPIEKEFKITPKAVTITAKGASKTYDGSALTQSEFTASALEAGDTHIFKVTMTAGSTITDFGTQANVIATVDGVNVTAGTATPVGNYSVTTANGTLTVHPRCVTLTSPDKTYTYDGTDHVIGDDEITVGGDGWAPGEGVTYSSKTSIRNVGTRPNEFTYTMLEGTRAENYSITKTEGTLEVTDDGVNPEKVVQLAISDSGAVYNLGDEITYTVTVTNIYDEAKTVTLYVPDGVTLDQTVFENVEPGDSVATVVRHTVTSVDIIAGKFETAVTADLAGKSFAVSRSCQSITAKNADISVTVMLSAVNGEAVAPGESVTAEVGDRLTFAGKAANNGNVTLTNVIIHDRLTGTDYAVGSLKPGEVSEEIQVLHIVTAADAAAGKIIDSVKVTAEVDDGETVSSEAEVEVSIKAEYKVTYVVDGEELTTLDATFGQSVPQPRTPQKEGYTFAWVDEIPEKMPAEDITINGSFTAIEYTAKFVNEAGETIKEEIFTVESKSITEPEVPEKAGYTGKWSEYTIGASDMTINPVYIPIEYTATFVDENGEKIKEVTFTVETESITEPAVPEKTNYTGKWEEYTLAAADITIKAEYTAIEYKAVFKADGKTVAEIPYTIETKSIEAPAVPEKEGYTGEWEDYKLAAGGITVNAVYTEIENPDEPDEPENEDLCPLDEKDHGTSFWGKLIRFVHTVIYKLFKLFGVNLFIRINFNA